MLSYSRNAGALEYRAPIATDEAVEAPPGAMAYTRNGGALEYREQAATAADPEPGALTYSRDGTGGRFSREVKAPWGYGWNTVRVADGEAALQLNWLQGNSQENDTGAAGVEFLDANGDSISEHLAAQFAPATAGDWEARTFSVDIPINAVSIRQLFDNVAVTGGTADSYIANFAVTIKPRA